MGVSVGFSSFVTDVWTIFTIINTIIVGLCCCLLMLLLLLLLSPLWLLLLSLLLTITGKYKEGTEFVNSDFSVHILSFGEFVSFLNYHLCNKESVLAEIILQVAVFWWKLQTMLTISPSHRTLIPCSPILALTPKCQASWGVATGMPLFLL